MKKGFIKILLLTIFTTVSIFLLQVKSVFASDKTYTSDYASYTEEEILATNDLGYGVIHNKIKAISTANTCSNPKSGYSLIDSPQQVNMLTVPSSGNVRIVNYTFPNASGWTKQTLTKLVQSFELTNPGWTVLAGVNGDFYDINGNDHALKYHTTGSTVSNGDVLRAVETKSIGYTNNGTSESFKIVDNASFTNYHILSIYDNNGEIIKTFDIDKVNEEPLNDELAVYFTYKVNVGESADTISVTVPSKNSYISENPLRCLPTSEPELFAKGEISKLNESIELRFGQFAIVTNNEEIKTYLGIGTNIRVQKDLTGPLADCDQVMGVGSTLVEHGDVSQNNSDGMRTQRHPRTCIGVKEDGTLMFFVIDGRQESSGYNGMTQDEMGTMMAYYDCYYGVNVDGGGSSTFGIRDEYGNFVIQNSPSDGNERTVSNALLVVVPQIQIYKSEIKDDSISLYYYEPTKGIEVDNIQLTINGITKEMTSTEFTFDGLEPETEYELSYTYDITYNGSTTNIEGPTYKFTTGKLAPSIDYAYYDINNNYVNLAYKINDVNNLATFCCIDYTDDIEFIEQFGEAKLNVKLANVQKFDFKIEIDYSAESIPNNNGKILYDFSWYPLSVDMSNLSTKKIEKIKEIIIDTNNAIRYVENKDDIISQINTSKQTILEIIAWDERIDTAVEQFIDEINELKIIIDSYYSEENQELITEYLENAIEELSKVKTLEETELIINNFYLKLDSVKTLEEEKEALDQFKEEKISELISYKNNKNYSKKNNEKAEGIISNATKKINSSKTAEEVINIYNDVIDNLDLIKTSSCKSNTIIIYTNIFMLFAICYVLLKKSK